jgi:hypothetical protein
VIELAPVCIGYGALIVREVEVFGNGVDPATSLA